MHRYSLSYLALVAAISSTVAPLPLFASTNTQTQAEKYQQQKLTTVDVSEITLDGASAISITFSAPLKGGQDLQALLSLMDEQTGKVDGAWEITKNKMEVRFRHIEPKRKLVVHISGDIESVGDRKLGQDESHKITTRDLQPSVGFASKGSLLPATLAAGIPVVALNVPQVDVDFFRVKPEKLVEFITRWGDNTALNWNTRELMPMADLVFGSRFDLKTEKNTRQTILLPVDGVTALKSPGVYVAVMHQAGSYDYTVPASLFTKSDIGVSMHRYHSSMTLLTQNLSTGEKLSGIQIQALNDKGEIVQTVESDDDGIASLVWNSKIKLLLAQKDDQVSMIPLNGPSLDLSEFKISGDYEHDNKLFFFAPRDLYRPGEKVLINALLRDKDGNRIPDQPIKAEIINAQGESVRTFVWKGDSGFYQYQYPVDLNASTGNWHLKATLGDREEQTFDFKVEDFLPETMALIIKNHETPLTTRDALDYEIEGRYLYGAPAAGNTLNGNLIIKVARNAVENLPGYWFGNSDDQRFEQNITLSDQSLSDEGKGTVTYDSEWGDSKSPLNLTLIANLQESGGRPVTRRSVQAVWPAEQLPAIHPLFMKGDIEDYRDDKADLSLDADSVAEFDLAMVSPDGVKHAKEDLVVRLIRERDDYYWYYSDGSWEYSSNKKDLKLSEDHVVLKDKEDTKVSFPVEWGGYRLEVEDPLTGAVAAVRFWAGYRWDESNGDGTSSKVVRPDQVKMALDKTSYKPGETAKVLIESASAGKGYLLVESKSGVLSKQYIEMPESGKGEFTVSVDPSWQQHDLYISTVLIRPASKEQNKTILPKRSVGLIHLPISRDARKINLQVEAPTHAMPNQPLKVHLKSDVKSQPVQVLLSAVDSGVLNITDFETPDPFKAFFGKRNYGVDQYDVYGQLIEGTSAPLATMRYGGDEDAAKGGKKPQPKVLIVAQQSKVVTLNDKGEADVSFDIPDFNGELRVMAQAWNNASYGAADQKVTVAAPIVTQMSMPRFLAGGDSALLAFDVTNNSGQAQDIKLNYKTSKKIVLNGDPEKAISLKPEERKTLYIPVKARNGFGDGTIDISLNGIKLSDADASMKKHWQIPVRPAYPAESFRYMTTFAKGKGWVLPENDVKGLSPDSLTLNVQVSEKPALDVSKQIRELQAYPYGCLEQTTSGVYPFLYLTSDVLKKMGIYSIDSDTTRLDKVQKGIDRVIGMQLDNGGFSLWDNSGSEEYWLTAYVTDFLFRAKEQGLNVPANVLEKAQQRLLRYVQDANSIEPYYSYHLKGERFAVQAYAGLVLASQNQAPLGGLRQIYQRKGDAESGLPLVQLGIALQKMGDRKRVNELLTSGMEFTPRKEGYYWYADYSSPVRDKALMLSLLYENKLSEKQLPILQSDLVNALQHDSYLSTQERNAVVLAARYQMNEKDSPWQSTQKLADKTITLNSDGNTTHYEDSAQIAQGVSVDTDRKEDLFLRADLTGYPLKRPDVKENKLHIQREWLTLSGQAVDPKTLLQGDLVVVHLTVKSDVRVPDALVVDLLPAGFEIENQNLAKTSMNNQDLAELHKLVELASQTPIKHQEFRDDRYVAAIDVDSYGKRDLVYIARVVSKGSFTVPMATVESMYQPEVSARNGLIEKIEIH